MSEACSSSRPSAKDVRVPQSPFLPWTPEETARRFHEAYEAFAPSFGYKTREASAKPWADVPQQNKDLMIAVIRNVFIEQIPAAEDVRPDVAGLRRAAALAAKGPIDAEVLEKLGLGKTRQVRKELSALKCVLDYDDKPIIARALIAIDELTQALAEAERQLAEYRADAERAWQFVAAVFQAYDDAGWGCDIDGGDIQEWGVRFGLLEEVDMTGCTDETDRCRNCDGDCDTCYRFTVPVQARVDDARGASTKEVDRD